MDIARKAAKRAAQMLGLVEKRKSRKGDPKFKASGAPSSWYDAAYSERTEYRKHFTESIYYPVWTVIYDRVRALGAKSVLEIGCGPGQLAQGLKNAVQLKYVGFDFSQQAIGMAKATAPEIHFEVANALDTKLYETVDFDTVICTEVLEHIAEDEVVMQKIPSGKNILATVPNTDSTTHVRFFDNPSQVADRYRKFFRSLDVTEILVAKNGAKIFLMSGQKI